MGSSAKCAIIIGGHTAKCAVTTAVPTTVTPEATAYHSAADRYIYSGPPRRAASPLFFSSFFFSFPPSYTLRRWVRGPGGGGGSAAYFYFPRNYFVWQTLKIDSRPPNAPARAHGVRGLGVTTAAAPKALRAFILPAFICPLSYFLALYISGAQYYLLLYYIDHISLILT